MKPSEILLEEWKQDLECMQFERDQYWKRFSILITINSGLLAFIGVILGLLARDGQINSVADQLQLFFCLIGIVGFGINASWMTMNFRSHEYYKFHLSHAILIEKRKEFDANDKSYLYLCGELHLHMRGLRLRDFYKAIPMTASSQFIPLCFGVIFVLISYTLISKAFYVYAFAVSCICVLIFLVGSGLAKLGSIHREFLDPQHV